MRGLLPRCHNQLAECLIELHTQQVKREPVCGGDKKLLATAERHVRAAIALNKNRWKFYHTLGKYMACGFKRICGWSVCSLGDTVFLWTEVAQVRSRSCYV